VPTAKNKERAAFERMTEMKTWEFARRAVSPVPIIPSPQSLERLSPRDGHPPELFMSASMRLYRGLTRPYQTEKVGSADLDGCRLHRLPLTALLYARGSRGVVLVLDVSAEGMGMKVTEEQWLGSPPAVHGTGKFEPPLVVVFPAKDSSSAHPKEGRSRHR